MSFSRRRRLLARAYAINYQLLSTLGVRHLPRRTHLYANLQSDYRDLSAPGFDGMFPVSQYALVADYI